MLDCSRNLLRSASWRTRTGRRPPPAHAVGSSRRSGSRPRSLSSRCWVRSSREASRSSRTRATCSPTWARSPSRSSPSGSRPARRRPPRPTATTVPRFWRRSSTRSWGLLLQAVNVLLEGTPTHLDLAEVEAAIVRVDGVRRVHDLHVWTLTSGREAMSAHVVVADVGESDRLLRELHAVLHARFGIDHTTIQLETEPPAVLRIQGPSSV